MLYAFLDESGTNPETPVLSVGGFYGTKEQWEVFRWLWRRYSVGFHATRSTRSFSLLCSAIECSKVRGVLLTVGKNTYKKYAGEHLQTAVGNTYSVCALLCAISICEQENYQPVSFVLEQGQPNLSFVQGLLQVMIDSGRWSVAAVTIAKKSDFIEMHTADFLSHIGSTHDVQWMERLFNADRLVHGHVTEEMLRDASPQVTELFRQARAARTEAKKTAQQNSE